MEQLVGFAPEGGELVCRTTIRKPGETLEQWYQENGSSEDLPQGLITFVDCNGTLVPVSTARRDGESLEDWYARHQARVEAKRKECGKGTS